MKIKLHCVIYNNAPMVLTILTYSNNNYEIKSMIFIPKNYKLPSTVPDEVGLDYLLDMF